MNYQNLLYPLVFLSSCFSCTSSEQLQEKQAFLKMTEDQNRVMIDLLEEKINRTYEEIYIEFNDFSKFEFLPLLPYLNGVKQQFDTIVLALDILENKPQTSASIAGFEIALDSALKQTIKIYNDLLDQYGEEPLGFKSNEIEVLKPQFRDSIEATQQDWQENNFPLLETIYAKPSIHNLKWKTRIKQYQLMRDLIEFSRTRKMERDYYFPVVNAKHCAVRKDQVFEAEISVGTYASSIRAQYITLIANGDTLKIDDRGKAYIKIPPTYKAGTNSLQLEALILNPLIDYSSYTHSTFEYQIFE